MPSDPSACKVLVFLQDKAGNLTETSEPNGIFENKGCRRGGKIWVFAGLKYSQWFEVLRLSS